MARGRSHGGKTRPVIYQLCRAGERFEVGDGPRDLSDNDDIVLGRGEPSRSRHNRYYVDDPWMSSKHARIRRRTSAPDQFTIEDDGSTNGVVVNGAPIKKVLLASGDLIETGRTFWLFVEEPSDLPIPDDPVEFGTWATWTPQLAEQLRMLTAHVDTGEHVLISGPTGTGKGYLARTIHLMSERSGRFVHLDCRERRPKRLEIDLFGGESQRARIREADLGTLFLENIDALPTSLQERLCDTLDERVLVSRGKRTRIDVRVIASTSGEPASLANAGRLTSRFVDTIGEIPFRLPGIDQRRADLGLLVDDFLARARGAPSISRDACRFVLTHAWRYHVKALARVIESAAVLATDVDSQGNRGGRIEPTHLPVEVIGDAGMRALAEDAMGRPPSSLHVASDDSGEGGALHDPERTSDLPENDPVDDVTSLPSRREMDDSEETHAASALDLPQRAPPGAAVPAPDFLDELRQVEQFVDHYDALEMTDPSATNPAAPPRVRAPMRPATAPVRPLTGQSEAVRPIDPSSAEAERPPSAYHDMESIERSYANAVDPDLIVEALRRARGNVSAAARYLGKPRALVLKWMREFQIDPYDYREG